MTVLLARAISLSFASRSRPDPCVVWASQAWRGWIPVADARTFDRATRTVWRLDLPEICCQTSTSSAAPMDSTSPKMSLCRPSLVFRMRHAASRNSLPATYLRHTILCNQDYLADWHNNSGTGYQMTFNFGTTQPNDRKRNVLKCAQDYSPDTQASNPRGRTGAFLPPMIH